MATNDVTRDEVLLRATASDRHDAVALAVQTKCDPDGLFDLAEDILMFIATGKQPE